MEERLPKTAVMEELLQRLTEIRKAADGLWYEYQILLRQQGREDEAHRKLKAYKLAMSEWRRTNAKYKKHWKRNRSKQRS